MAQSNAERQRRYRERQKAKHAANEALRAPDPANADYAALTQISQRALSALQSADNINATEAIRIIKLRIDADRLRQAQAVARPTVRASLRDFAAEVWPIVASGRTLIPTWHVDALCEHLTALSDGRIRRLLVCLPPRMAKSVLCSIVWPAWTWTFAPERRILSASYSAKLAEGFAASHRALLKSPWWSERYDVRIASDMDTRSRFRNSAGGERIATSVGGSTLGLGGDALILDDVHHPAEIRSQTEREKAIDWHRTSWITRADRPNEARMLVVGQRLHPDDLPGELIRSGDWTALILPNERGPEACRTSLPWTDPRTEGALLCPQLLGEGETKRRQRALGDEYRAQYQQDPQPVGGALFTRETIQTIDAVPDDWTLGARVRYWDPAANKPRIGYSDPDYTVGCRMARYTRPDELPVWVTEDIVRFRAEPATVDARILATAEADGPEVRIVEEQQPGAAGKHVISQRRGKLNGYSYSGRRMTGDKEVRFGPLSTQTKAGNVVLLAGDWNEAAIKELVTLPGRHDDQADAMSGAYVTLAAAPIEAVDGGVF